MLTENAIIKAKPKEKLYRIADGLKNGLSLEVSPGEANAGGSAIASEARPK